MTWFNLGTAWQTVGFDSFCSVWQGARHGGLVIWSARCQVPGPVQSGCRPDRKLQACVCPQLHATQVVNWTGSDCCVYTYVGLLAADSDCLYQATRTLSSHYGWAAARFVITPLVPCSDNGSTWQCHEQLQLWLDSALLCATWAHSLALILPCCNDLRSQTA